MNSRGVRLILLWKLLRKLGAPFQMEKKNSFVWLHGFVTWELETKGLDKVRNVFWIEGTKVFALGNRLGSQNQILSVPVC